MRETERMGLNPIIASSVMCISLSPEMFPDKYSDLSFAQSCPQHQSESYPLYAGGEIRKRSEMKSD